MSEEMTDAEQARYWWNEAAGKDVIIRELRASSASQDKVVEGLREAAVLLVDESERILFAKQENGGDFPGLSLALTRMNAALARLTPGKEG